MKNEWSIILKRVRGQKKLSLRDIEKKIGISNAYLSQLENGKINEPGFFLMLRLLSLYGISVKNHGDIWEYSG